MSTETKNKKNQILEDIALINQALREIANILDNNGVNNQTINTINNILLKIEININRVSSTVQSMTDSQLDGFTVPWMDGRYIGIMTYLMSFSTMMNKIDEEFKRI